MIKVHLTGNQYSFHQFHFPLRVFKDELLNLEITIKFFTNVAAPGIDACDVLIFYDDNYRSRLPIQHRDRQSAIKFLQDYFRRFNKVIWFDGNAGSGWLRSYIFPYVDIYTKAGLLINRHYYKEVHPAGMIHRDYVKEKFGIDDSKRSKDLLTDEGLTKLRVSWNRAFHNWHFINRPLFDTILDHVTKKQYQFRYTTPNLVNRSKIIPYRMNYWPNHPTIKWWRESTRDQLKNVLVRNPSYRLNAPERLSKRKFNQELRHSLVTVSPFGLGEICYRDFESFINGSLLFKPSMDHLSTWPNFYVDNVTYISHKWDFSDFNDKLEDILTHPARYEEVAREGQDRFRQALSDGNGFAKHFAELIA